LDKIKINKKSALGKLSVDLPASKSISNRALIISALAGSDLPIQNLSEARDTETMIRLLKSKEHTLDVLDAGTTMRFLCAYLSISNNKYMLTGTKRMQERPIKILVDALRKIGSNISYLNEEGFPPLEIRPFENQKTNIITVRGDVSSQYISALMMIAPTLPDGLELTLEGEVGSIPYISMTLSIMKEFGIHSTWTENKISIPNQTYNAASIIVEPDWSAASYWYSFVALSKDASVFIKDLKRDSIQGDSVVAEIMTTLGVETTFTSEGAYLKKADHKNYFEYDFSHCPDLAQTIAVICAAKSISCKMTGLKSLKIKETDRVMALQNELKKIGAKLVENKEEWSINPSKEMPNEVQIETYDDHRMAMAFAPLLCLSNIVVENPDVVNKSYPSFWDDLRKNNIL